MTVVRNLIKIIVPIIIVAGFFFIMSNFKHTQTLSLAEEKRIKAGSRAQKCRIINSINPEWKDLWETEVSKW